MSQSVSISTVEILIPIWQRVLQCPSARPEDNFFDLGGDTSAARHLFLEISEALGRDLAPVTICQAPTILQLAALLEERDPHPIPPLLLLKPGVGGPPVFITHGIGSTVLDLVKLARGMETEQPVYGLQLRGMNGAEEPLDTIEAMADYFLVAMKSVQPHGPYFLLGYSLGGLMTLEIAQRLSARGEEIALLAMVDSYPHLQQLSSWQRARLIARRAYLHLARLMKMPAQKVPSYLRHHWEHRSRVAAFANPETERAAALREQQRIDREPPFLGRLADKQPVNMVRTAQLVRDKAEVALVRYQPRFYKGRIRFVKSEIDSYFPDDPFAIWDHLALDFECETHRGDHLSILTQHYDDLAALLSRYLRESANQA